MEAIFGSFLPLFRSRTGLFSPAGRPQTRFCVLTQILTRDDATITQKITREIPDGRLPLAPVVARVQRGKSLRVNSIDGGLGFRSRPWRRETSALSR